MLNERQLSLLEKLENQSLTMVALSRGLNVSSRTVLRDIDYLNFTLSGTAHIITTPNGYQLDIFDRRSYFMQLQRHDNDDRMLFLLLTNPFVTRLQLAETLNLPEKIVNDKLTRLKLRYERWFTITSKPNSGHFVDEPRRKKLIILANLVKKDPQIAGAETEFFALQQQLTGKSDNPEFMASLLVAVYTLRNQGAEPENGNADTFRAVYDAAGMYLSEPSLREADALTNLLRERALSINEPAINELVGQLWQAHGLEEYDQQLIVDLTAHIARCAACPVWLQESRQGSMNNLKAAWPVAFDLSIGLINQIRQRLNIEIYDSDLVGLYFACALERNQGEKHTIVLLAAQNAIATINQMAIERELLNCRVVIARTPDRLRALSEEITPVLVINNSHFALNDFPIETITIKNIIGQAGINLLKEKLEYALIKQKLPLFIPEELSFLYANRSDENWLDVIEQICARLVNEKLLHQGDAQRVYQRESEGQNLVVNHIAIPHCWSESSEKFRGYFIRLAQPVMVNNQMVWHLLLACTSSASRQELKIFSYLANALNGCEPQTISGLKSYDEFMALLA
ncbi:putative frv operon regulatory protein [Buttiauxella brennerae ATCC 51605]|uniref:Putative frv operon regulatory protein n=1 Tax=Buttiauxella brennerae ATCC 51605 TaxID=1354251 RepID=A0A1B7IHI6_9ENTR|nr:putative frv operon regulatory protein [Buttiauxella brennerae]OAT28863.1 putative frv operon regulatory protein [Buttiauxella brennerae ATCC 51605]